jgi:hypothetical protein
MFANNLECQDVILGSLPHENIMNAIIKHILVPLMEHRLRGSKAEHLSSEQKVAGSIPAGVIIYYFEPANPHPHYRAYVR